LVIVIQGEGVFIGSGTGEKIAESATPMKPAWIERLLLRLLTPEEEEA
jgi:hypothetical protein